MARAVVARLTCAQARASCGQVEAAAFRLRLPCVVGPVAPFDRASHRRLVAAGFSLRPSSLAVVRGHGDAEAEMPGLLFAVGSVACSIGHRIATWYPQALACAPIALQWCVAAKVTPKPKLAADEVVSPVRLPMMDEIAGW